MRTVAAISTPPGQGGVALIRVSGSAAYKIADKVFKPRDNKKDIKAAKGYTALYGNFYSGDIIIDEGIALFFKAPHSYTGEDVVELSCHGGEIVANSLLHACLKAGAFPAEAGEFTKRAVLNGRLSLTQAEAVMDIIAANSKQSLALAEAALSGALNKKIEAIKQKLVTLAGHLAAYTDFPEEDVETLTAETFLDVLQQVEKDLTDLIKEYDKGLLFRRGISAAIIGSPNVGKSTLFNLLLGQDRAIVTPVAGTTRDVVQESIQLGGVQLNISDTAGLHETQDIVEAEGIRRSYLEIEKSALLLVVFDGSEKLSAEDFALAEKASQKASLAVINKTDLAQKIEKQLLVGKFTKVVEVSANDFSAREIIAEAVVKLLDLDKFDLSAASIANERQLAVVVAAKEATHLASETLKNGFTFDAAGVYLEDALNALASLTGAAVSEEILGEVFSSFCVGK